MSLTERFIAWWCDRYPASPPVGFALRGAYPDRWVRIHSLPGSRRYPGDDADWAELLRRHREVGTHILGTGGRCFVVLAGCTPPEEAFAPESLLAGIDTRDLVFEAAAAPFEVPLHEPIRVAVAACTWDPDRLEPLLRAKANDEIGPLALVAEMTAEVYAPYDGGADMVLEPSRVDIARRRFKEWLSPRENGL